MQKGRIKIQTAIRFFIRQNKLERMTTKYTTRSLLSDVIMGGRGIEIFPELLDSEQSDRLK